MRLVKRRRKAAIAVMKEILAERGIVVRMNTELYQGLNETHRLSILVHELAHIWLLDLRGWNKQKKDGWIADNWAPRTTNVSPLSRYLDSLSFSDLWKEELLAVSVQARVLALLGFFTWLRFGKRKMFWFDNYGWKKSDIQAALRSKPVNIVASQIMSKIMEVAG